MSEVEVIIVHARLAEVQGMNEAWLYMMDKERMV
jgi:hypothetical protein